MSLRATQTRIRLDELVNCLLVYTAIRMTVVLHEIMFGAIQLIKRVRYLVRQVSLSSFAKECVHLPGLLMRVW